MSSSGEEVSPGGSAGPAAEDLVARVLDACGGAVAEKEARFFLEAAGNDLTLAMELAVAQADEQRRGEGVQQRQQHAGVEDGAGGLRRRRAPTPEADGGPLASSAAPSGSGQGRVPGAGPSSGGNRALAATAAVALLCFRFVKKLLVLAARIARGACEACVHSAGVILHVLVPSRLAQFLRRHVLPRLVPLGPEAVDPAEAARRFAEDFAREYGAGSAVPSFERCSHWDAVCLAHAQSRFLCCYLHAPEHSDARAFCRETLCNPQVLALLRDRFVVWGGDVSRSREALRLSQALQVGRYPCLAVVTHSQVFSHAGAQAGARGGPASSVSLVAMFEGLVAAPELARMLGEVCDEHGEVLVAARRQQQRRASDRQIRAEQESAFQAALEEDRRREAKREAAEAEERREREEERRQEEERMEQERRARECEEERGRELEGRRERAVAHLEARGECAEGAASVILLRTPDGARHKRRFPASDPVSEVFAFADSLGSNPFLRYNLVSSFPRKVFDREREGGDTIQHAGLVPDASLFVQSLDD